MEITIVAKEIDIETGKMTNMDVTFPHSLAKRMHEWVLLGDMTTDSLIIFLTDEEILKIKAEGSIKMFQELLMDELLSELEIGDSGVSLREKDKICPGDCVKVEGKTGIVETQDGDMFHVRLFVGNRFLLDWFPKEKIERKVKDSSFFS